MTLPPGPVRKPRLKPLPFRTRTPSLSAPPPRPAVPRASFPYPIVPRLLELHPGVPIKLRISYHPLVFFRLIRSALLSRFPQLPPRISVTIVSSFHSQHRSASRSPLSRRHSMESAAAPQKIGLIGLGLMGRPMGMNLLKAGYTLTVWNRTASRADELVAAGAKLAKSPQELAANSDFLLTMVSDPPALEEVLWGPHGAMPVLQRGSIYMDCTTISPSPSRPLATACSERGVRFLDAPVTGGDWGAKKGELVFMIGGDAATLRDAEPILGVMGKKWFHLGPNGAGQTIKLALNMILPLPAYA